MLPSYHDFGAIISDQKITYSNRILRFRQIPSEKNLNNLPIREAKLLILFTGTIKFLNCNNVINHG